MEKVSVNDSKLFSQAASQWRMIGHLLKIPPGSLDRIGYDSRTARDSLLAVFTEWSTTQSSPYLWRTILNVLATVAVGHRRLADDIAHRLSGEIGAASSLHVYVSVVFKCILGTVLLYHKLGNFCVHKILNL